MSKYRNNLPQLNGEVFLTDGGLETTLVFHEGMDLPDFAAFDVLKHEHGRQTIDNYFRTYVDIAKKIQAGIILDSVTWRSNSDWGTRLGYNEQSLAKANRQSIEMHERIRDEFEDEQTKVVISGCIGPRGDGYNPEIIMNPAEAEKYHTDQIRVFAGTAADLVTALTMTYAEEAIGIVRAARKAGMPVVISFTVETDGRLPSGQTLRDAIGQVDRETDDTPIYYMINCAHPTHFEDALAAGEPWVQRIRGIRANASTKSHAELDNSDELDIGNPVELGNHYRQLREAFPHFNVLGGCCGTDHRHIHAIGSACVIH